MTLGRLLKDIGAKIFRTHPKKPGIIIKKETAIGRKPKAGFNSQPYFCVGFFDRIGADIQPVPFHTEKCKAGPTETLVIFCLE